MRMQCKRNFYHVPIKESAAVDAGLALILVYGESLLVAVFKRPTDWRRIVAGLKSRIALSVHHNMQSTF